MRLLIPLFFAWLMLATLVGCKASPSATPPEKDSPIEPPAQETTAWGHISDDEYDIINTHTIDGGEFVFKEKKYEFQGSNLVIADVKNETENNYTLVVHCSYFDEAGEQVFTESRTYEGWAAGYTQPILFLPMMAFDSYEYSIEVKPYDGACFGANYIVEFAGLNEDRREPLPGLFGKIKESNYNTVSTWRGGTVIIWDNNGEIYMIETFGAQTTGGQYVDVLHRHAVTLCIYETEESPRPENLTGELKGMVIPYFSDNIYEMIMEIGDYRRIHPDIPPPDPDMFPH